MLRFRWKQIFDAYKWVVSVQVIECLSGEDKAQERFPIDWFTVVLRIKYLTKYRGREQQQQH